MRRLIKFAFGLGVILLTGFTNNANACNNSLLNIANVVNNGDGTYTYTLDLTTELGGLDIGFYGFALSFNSAYNTPTVVAGSFDATLTTADLTSGTLSTNLQGRTGAGVNSVALDSDFNKYDNLTNVLTYESFSIAASNDISLTLTVTIDGCVESIEFDGSVNSGASSCRKTASTGLNCQCTATSSPTSPSLSDTVCQEVGGTIALTGNVGGTLGTNPAYAWSSTDATVNALIADVSAENTSITFPINFASGTYPVNFTYTDDNNCILSTDLTFVVAETGQGSCTNTCDFSTITDVIITPDGSHNATAGFTQVYVLTTEDSVIVATSTTGDFGLQVAGNYLAFAINTEDADPPTPFPAVGVDIQTMANGCFGLSNALTIGVCEPCIDPAAQPTNITLSNENTNSFDISWTNSAATDVIVVIREISSGISAPVPGSTYNGNTVFGSGDDLGGGNYVLYSGFTAGASPLTVTGLTITTTYVVSIYAANDTCILTTAPLIDTTTTQSCTAPATIPSSVMITALTGTTVGLSWTNGSGDQLLVTIRESSVTHSDPISGTSYTGSTVYGGGDEITTGHFVVYSGAAGLTSGTITGLTINTTYTVSLYSFNATGDCYNVTELDTTFTTPFENNIINDTLYMCGGLLYDDGGPSGNYANGANIETVLMPSTTGDGVCLNFTEWTLDYNALGYTELSFYDGTNTSAPLIMTATGEWSIDEPGTEFDQVGPGMVCSTGPMTLLWNPDAVNAGFEATVTCYTPLDTPSCAITVNLDTTICAGETLDLSAIGEIINVPLDITFDDSTVGTGWTTSVDARFDNPCGAGPDSLHLWMGIETSPRTLTSTTIDASQGGTVSFDFKMATQGVGAPCEGPDLPDEGVYLQYSADGGTNWSTIHYFWPSFYTDGSAHTLNWQNYVFDIPAAAQGATTQFRWIQNNISSNSTDHWGLDNVVIGIPTNNPSIVWDNGLGSGADKTVNPTVATTYTATISDGSTSCQASVNVAMCSAVSINSNSFNGVCNGSQVKLSWEGIHSPYEEEYIIEKASNGLNFVEIARMPTSSSSGNQNFTYMDLNPQNNSSYYRIKVKDVDGHSSYTDIIGPLGNCKLIESGIYDSYFDSESGKIVLFYSLDETSSVNLSLYDISGRLIDQKLVGLNGDGHQIQVSMNKPMANSIYILQASGPSGVYHKKIYVRKNK